MFKTIITTAALVVSATAAQAHQKCWVNAENPNQENVYNQVVLTAELKLKAGDAKIFDRGAYFIAFSKTPNAALQIATYSKEAKPKIYALAFAKTDSLTVLDGQNKIMVLCQESK